jgi:hypothetical protein
MYQNRQPRSSVDVEIFTTKFWLSLPWSTGSNLETAITSILLKQSSVYIDAKTLKKALANKGLRKALLDLEPGPYAPEHTAHTT